MISSLPNVLQSLTSGLVQCLCLCVAFSSPCISFEGPASSAPHGRSVAAVDRTSALAVKATSGVSHFIITVVTLALSSLYHLLTIHQESRLSGAVHGSSTLPGGTSRRPTACSLQRQSSELINCFHPKPRLQPLYHNVTMWSLSHHRPLSKTSHEYAFEKWKDCKFSSVCLVNALVMATSRLKITRWKLDEVKIWWHVQPRHWIWMFAKGPLDSTSISSFKTTNAMNYNGINAGHISTNWFRTIFPVRGANTFWTKTRNWVIPQSFIKGSGFCTLEDKERIRDQHEDLAKK